jgi:hypothetical protein
MPQFILNSFSPVEASCARAGATTPSTMAPASSKNVGLDLDIGEPPVTALPEQQLSRDLSQRIDVMTGRFIPSAQSTVRDGSMTVRIHGRVLRHVGVFPDLESLFRTAGPANN